jgi:hypothetical protein
VTQVTRVAFIRSLRIRVTAVTDGLAAQGWAVKSGLPPHLSWPR